MKKILAFVCSPRKDGYSTQLLNKVIDGAQSIGAEVVTFDMNDAKIRGCQSCYYCRSHEGCAIQDDLQSMYEQIKDADAIIATFPLYFMDINSQSKKLVDRWYPMMDSSFAARYPGKKVIAIYSQGNANPDFMKNSIDANNGIIIHSFGWNLVKSFLIYNTALPEFAIPDEMMQEAYNIGQSLVE